MRKYVNILNKEVHLGLIVMFCVILLLSTVLATIYYTKTIDHQARIINDGKIQTYTDAGFTVVLDSHDWGDFNTSAGNDVKTLDFYLRNEGNTAINVTWSASGFTTYNQTGVRYETSSWRLYLVQVSGTETTLRPENATTPSKVLLSAGAFAHLKFYLTAIDSSAPEDFSFDTSFSSHND
jgi:archaellum component FlaG (FlaF/FlaG flagellin family)